MPSRPRNPGSARRALASFVLLFAAPAVAATGTAALGADVRVNDKSSDATCSACFNRPLVQAGTTIAATV